MRGGEKEAPPPPNLHPELPSGWGEKETPPQTCILSPIGVKGGEKEKAPHPQSCILSPHLGGAGEGGKGGEGNPPTLKAES